MSLRVIVAMAVAAMLAFAFAAWNISTQMTPPPAGSGGASPAPASPAPAEPAPAEPAPGEVAAPTAADPGVTWRVPKRWTIDLAQGMRVATYLVPAAGGEGGECAVYYFGQGQGGGVDANLERWMGEFQPLDDHAVQKLRPGGLEVTRVAAHGTYAAHSMRGAETPARKPSWALMGAIVNGPRGAVFFKLVGPAAAVDGAAKEFDAMLGSMRKK